MTSGASRDNMVKKSAKNYYFLIPRIADPIALKFKCKTINIHLLSDPCTLPLLKDTGRLNHLFTALDNFVFLFFPSSQRLEKQSTKQSMHTTSNIQWTRNPSCPLSLPGFAVFPGDFKQVKIKPKVNERNSKRALFLLSCK